MLTQSVKHEIPRGTARTRGRIVSRVSRANVNITRRSSACIPNKQCALGAKAEITGAGNPELYPPPILLHYLCVSADLTTSGATSACSTERLREVRADSGMTHEHGAH